MLTAAEKNKADAIARALKQFVDVLLLAMVNADIKRKECDAIQRRLLASGRYGGDGEPKNVYLLPDEAASRYFFDLDKAYCEAGYKDLQPGHCPALIAEHLRTQAEWALIAAAEEFFPGVTNDRLLCGTGKGDGLETRQRYIDLLIGMVVNHPDYVPLTGRKGK